MALENGDIIFVKLGSASELNIFKHYHETFEYLKEFLFAEKGIKVEFVLISHVVETITVLGKESIRKKDKELDGLLEKLGDKRHYRTIRI
jgi:hypothetical protein